MMRFGQFRRNCFSSKKTGTPKILNFKAIPFTQSDKWTEELRIPVKPAIDS